MISSAGRIKLVLASLACLFPAALPVSAQTQTTEEILSGERPVQVSPHVWKIIGYPNVMIVVGTRATLVVDTGMGSKNGQTVSAAALRLSPPGNKLYLTTTHFHPEHAAGDGGFPPGTQTIRPRAQQAELDSEGQRVLETFRNRSAQSKELLADARIRTAEILFDKEYKLDLGGGVEARLFWFGPAHTKGDEVVLVSPDSALITGDVVQNKTGPFLFCTDCTPRSWIAVLDQIAPLQPKIIVPDHSDVGGTDLIAAERDILSFVQARTTALKAQGKSVEDATKTVTDEVTAKYAGWTGLARINSAITKSYADPG